MRENELADLLIRMAADKGIGVEAATEELASVAMPSFVDPRVFRAAVLQSLEQHLRAQVEDRLQSMRRRFELEPQARATPHPSTPYASPAQQFVTPASPMPAVEDTAPVMADATMADMGGIDVESAAPDNGEEDMPSDATMVWTTRHG